jgi:hypothetical protein
LLVAFDGFADKLRGKWHGTTPSVTTDGGSKESTYHALEKKMTSYE